MADLRSQISETKGGDGRRVEWVNRRRGGRVGLGGPSVVQFAVSVLSQVAVSRDGLAGEVMAVRRGDTAGAVFNRQTGAGAERADDWRARAAPPLNPPTRSQKEPFATSHI